MRHAIVLLIVCAACFAQDGPTTIVSKGPQAYCYQRVYGFSGGNLVYTCKSRCFEASKRPQTQVSISAATNANPVVFTSTGHGFDLNSRPKVTISGGTGNWTAINGTFTATMVDANSFSIAVDSTSLGGALAGTIKFTTTAPRTTVAEWEVEQYAYDGSGNLAWAGYLNGTSAPNQKRSDAALTTTNRQ